MHPRIIKRCRVCGNPSLEKTMDFGEQYLQGSFVKPGCQMPPKRKLPLELVRCDPSAQENACGLLQLAHTFPPEILYANYWYRSGTNATMRNHLVGIVGSVLEVLGATEQDRKVLDIGCNDGTLLAAYPAHFVKIGVDPSDIAREIPPPAQVINTVFPSPDAMAAIGEHSVDVVTSIAMFYDLDDPVAFARAVGALLKQDGVWVLEMSYLPLMLAKNAFDTVCHEHLEYYSLDVLEHIMRQAGLKIFKASLNEINGGSIRCYVCRQESLAFGTPEASSFLSWLRIREFEMELDTPTPYQTFQQRAEALRRETTALLTRLRSDGARIHVYGASTKGNVLLQWYGLNRLWIEAAADRNPIKVGASTLGTGIPIIDEASSRAMKPDYYLVLPWHFLPEFLRRERETVRSGTKLIVPLPELCVVEESNIEEIIAQCDASEGQGVNSAELLIAGYRA